MRFTSAMQMSMYAVSPLISVSDIFYFEMRRKRFEEKSNQNISWLYSRFTKRSEKKVVFLSVGQTKKVSVCPFLPQISAFSQRETKNAFYDCLKKQREGEQKDVVQRGVGVVCRRVVVVVVRSNDVLVLVLL